MKIFFGIFFLPQDGLHWEPFCHFLYITNSVYISLRVGSNKRYNNLSQILLCTLGLKNNLSLSVRCLNWCFSSLKLIIWLLTTHVSIFPWHDVWAFLDNFGYFKSFWDPKETFKGVNYTQKPLSSHFDAVSTEIRRFEVKWHVGFMTSFDIKDI